MRADARERPWLDVLNRKHECGPSLFSYVTLNLEHNGRSIRVRVPDSLNGSERLEILATLSGEKLLGLIGRHTMKGDDPYERGILMVAREESKATFVVHVWHELYPRALGYLGLKEDLIEE